MWQLKIQYFSRFWSILADFGWFWWYCRDFIAKSTQIAFMSRYITINKAENANSGRFWVSGADFGLSELDFGWFWRFSQGIACKCSILAIFGISCRFVWFLKLCTVFIGIGFPELSVLVSFGQKWSKIVILSTLSWIFGWFCQFWSILAGFGWIWLVFSVFEIMP